MSKKVNKPIETQFNERRGITSDPKQMLNMFTTKRVLRTWKEDFVDQDSGEVTSIERNEVLFERGIFIDQDVLAQIRFYMEAGDIREVEVSNQRRVAFHHESTYLRPFMAQAEILDKKTKFLFYATTVDLAFSLLKDYIELNYRAGFIITEIKQYSSCIIITDTLKKLKESEENKEETEEEKAENQKKFYQIECRIEVKEDNSYTQDFVVHSFNVDRCMMLIDAYLKEREEQSEKEAKEKGREYDKREFHTMIEVAKPISIGRFIPKEFSEAYTKK